MKSKQEKRQTVLNALILQAEDLRNQRATIQSQALEFLTIVPCDTELRIAQEINRVKYNLGLPAQVSECPF